MSTVSNFYTEDICSSAFEFGASFTYDTHDKLFYYRLKAARVNVNDDQDYEFGYSDEQAAPANSSPKPLNFSIQFPFKKSDTSKFMKPNTRYKINWWIEYWNKGDSSQKGYLESQKYGTYTRPSANPTAVASFTVDEVTDTTITITPTFQTSCSNDEIYYVAKVFYRPQSSSTAQIKLSSAKTVYRSGSSYKAYFGSITLSTSASTPYVISLDILWGYSTVASSDTYPTNATRVTDYVQTSDPPAEQAWDYQLSTLYRDNYVVTGSYIDPSETGYYKSEVTYHCERGALPVSAEKKLTVGTAETLRTQLIWQYNASQVNFRKNTKYTIRGQLYFRVNTSLEWTRGSRTAQISMLTYPEAPGVSVTATPNGDEVTLTVSITQDMGGNADNIWHNLICRQNSSGTKVLDIDHATTASKQTSRTYTKTMTLAPGRYSLSVQSFNEASKWDLDHWPTHPDYSQDPGSLPVLISSWTTTTVYFDVEDPNHPNPKGKIVRWEPATEVITTQSSTGGYLWVWRTDNLEGYRYAFDSGIGRSRKAPDDENIETNYFDWYRYQNHSDYYFTASQLATAITTTRTFYPGLRYDFTHIVYGAYGLDNDALLELDRTSGYFVTAYDPKLKPEATIGLNIQAVTSDRVDIIYNIAPGNEYTAHHWYGCTIYISTSPDVSPTNYQNRVYVSAKQFNGTSEIHDYRSVSGLEANTTYYFMATVQFIPYVSSTFPYQDWETVYAYNDIGVSSITVSATTAEGVSVVGRILKWSWSCESGSWNATAEMNVEREAYKALLSRAYTALTSREYDSNGNITFLIPARAVAEFSYHVWDDLVSWILSVSKYLDEQGEFFPNTRVQFLQQKAELDGVRMTSDDRMLTAYRYCYLVRGLVRALKACGYPESLWSEIGTRKWTVQYDSYSHFVYGVGDVAQGMEAATQVRADHFLLLTHDLNEAIDYWYDNQ